MRSLAPLGMTRLLTHISTDVAASLCEAFLVYFIVQAARLAETRLQSFDENSTATTARMSISGKIHFCYASVAIG
jgi:hypothetical protein